MLNVRRLLSRRAVKELIAMGARGRATGDSVSLGADGGGGVLNVRRLLSRRAVKELIAMGARGVLLETVFLSVRMGAGEC